MNGRTCACVHKVMQQLRRQEIEALSSLSISSFDTMKLEYYPSVADPEVGESIRTYMAEVLADLRDYAADFSPATRESLLLLGNAGLGKTHAALAIAGEVLRPAALPVSSRSSSSATISAFRKRTSKRKSNAKALLFLLLKTPMQG